MKKKSAAIVRRRLEKEKSDEQKYSLCAGVCVYKGLFEKEEERNRLKVSEKEFVQ